MEKNKVVLCKLVLCLLLLSILGACATIPSDKDAFPMCADDVSRNSQRLLSLMADSSGRFIDRDDAAFGDFQSAFRAKLNSVDLRAQDQMAFYFVSGHPEVTRKVVFCDRDQYLIPPDHLVSEDVKQVRIEPLGINGEGYMRCIRIQEQWFYVETYLPT